MVPVVLGPEEEVVVERVDLLEGAVPPVVLPSLATRPKRV